MAQMNEFRKFFRVYSCHLPIDEIRVSKNRALRKPCDAEFQGLGVGTALLRELIERTRKMGVRKCMLDVATTNPRAQNLYERLRFNVVQDNKWNYPDSKIHVPGQRRMELIFAT